MANKTLITTKHNSKRVSKNAKTCQLEQRYLNCSTISGTRFHHCFIPLSKSKLVIKRLSLDDEGVLVKFYNNTTKSVVPHLQLIENDLCPEKYIAFMIKIGTLV